MIPATERFVIATVLLLVNGQRVISWNAPPHLEESGGEGRGGGLPIQTQESVVQSRALIVANGFRKGNDPEITCRFHPGVLTWAMAARLTLDVSCSMGRAVHSEAEAERILKISVCINIRSSPSPHPAITTIFTTAMRNKRKFIALDKFINTTINKHAYVQNAVLILNY